ncbi:hypothetical protein [Frankia sp. AvcI1]|nr:hypothetical protein [Frankia sp. AvcI1]
MAVSAIAGESLHLDNVADLDQIDDMLRRTLPTPCAAASVDYAA